MEQYEEYLNYYDPLAPYDSDQRYEEGLPWGNKNEIGSDKGSSIWGTSQGTDCSQNYTMGNTFTPIIAEHNEQEIMTLNDLPNSAAAYCLNKNKRNRNGEVEDVIWYLPGIRELERILEDYYIEYTEFQNNYYWSSAAGEDKFITVTYENQQRARATKAYIENGEFHYYESGDGHDYTNESGTGGAALRTQSLRIRAARIDAEAQ